MSSRRDNVYTQLFSHPEIVRDLVVGFLSAEWAKGLTIDAFERVNASYANEDGKTRREDVVWRARIGGDWVYVYLLLEFQSRPDKWMALRMQVYIGLLYQDLVAQHKLSKHGKLPPVLPIVFYHGRRPWTAATELSRLMWPPPVGLERFQANQQYLLIDRHHDQQRGDIVSLLFRLLHSRAGAAMHAALDTLAERIRDEDMAPARRSLINWIQLTLQDISGMTSMDLEEELTMKTRRKLTIDEIFSPDILAYPDRKAMEKGRQEGLRQGELLALQTVLRESLGKDMPDGMEAKILSARPDELRAAIKSLMNGADARQLFADV